MRADTGRTVRLLNDFIRSLRTLYEETTSHPEDEKAKEKSGIDENESEGEREARTKRTVIKSRRDSKRTRRSRIGTLSNCHNVLK